MTTNLSDLKYFLEVANTLNVTKAARRLAITQPSLSLAIQRLEETVGVPLIMRSTSGVQLTKAGYLFLTQAKEIVEKWNEIKNVTQQFDKEISGRYALGCHASLAIYILPTFLPDLVKSFSNLEIDLIHNISFKIVEDVINFKIDFGIVIDPPKHKDLVIRKLGSDEVGFFVRANNSPLSYEKDVLICDHQLVQTQMLFKKLQQKKIYFKRHIYTPRLDVVTALVDSGIGVGILPKRAAAMVNSKQIKLIEELPSIKNQICLIYRQEAAKSKAMRKIARFIEEKAKWE